MTLQPMLSDMWSKTTTCLNPSLLTSLLTSLILLFGAVVKFF
jgi:hypothetical protein